MKWKLNPNVINQISKDTDFFVEGDTVFSVAMIVKGNVLIHNKGAKLLAGSGSFLGINDLYAGKYISTYTAYDDAMIYVFPVSRVEELETVLSVNKDYHGLMVASFNKIIYDLEQTYESLVKNGLELSNYIKNTYRDYLELAESKGFQATESERYLNSELSDDGLEVISDRIKFYSECKKLPIEAVKLFYSYGNLVTLYQLEDQVSIINRQMEALKEVAGAYIRMIECLVDDTDTCLFSLMADISNKTDNVTNNELMDILDGIIEELNKAELLAQKLLGRKPAANRKKMEEVYHRLLTMDKPKVQNTEAAGMRSKEDIASALNEVKDSFAKILEYAGITGAPADEMKKVLQSFIAMPDKLSSEDTARVIRRQLTENHYTIYKPVFLRAYKEKQPPRIIEMFLKYGYTDERLLTKEQLLWLYFLPEETPRQQYCKIHDIYSWLVLIYEGKREPSKNEFDMEYPEMLAQLKKQAKLTAKDEALWLTDPEIKVEYEIQNMFRYNNRTTSGQLASFVPVLHKEQWNYHVDRMQVTANKLDAAIEEILKIDYSLFDREVIYSNNEKNIVKEYVIKRVYPDIILMPNIGSNGIMWQEISGKRRDSAGRFLLPILNEVNISLLLTRIFGRFRWELCRTIEGVSWNDITHKSLTSEYSDYLQFYRKNKELSEEKKEKIKLQIQKGRNSSREIFVIDYEQWINYESHGAIKLNKTVREMLATYCPFAKELREQLKQQPIFEEAMARFFREKQKKIREVEARYRMLQKEKIELTQELVDTLEYYKNT